MLPAENIIEAYKSLADRLQKLKSTYDFVPDLYGITEEQREKLRIFEILTHAELEGYFESIATIIIENSKKVWENTKCANYNLVALFISSEAYKKSGDTLETKVYYIINEYQKKISENNGVKSKNICNLFNPLGYNKDDFDNLFLQELDNLGKERGAYVHLPAKEIYHTRQNRSKMDVFQNVDNILNGLIDSNTGFQQIILDKIT